MPTPVAPRIILSQNARSDLHALIRAHSTPQSLVRRARIVLRASALDQPSTLKISRFSAVIAIPLASGDNTIFTWA